MRKRLATDIPGAVSGAGSDTSPSLPEPSPGAASSDIPSWWVNEKGQVSQRYVTLRVCYKFYLLTSLRELDVLWLMSETSGVNQLRDDCQSQECRAELR